MTPDFYTFQEIIRYNSNDWNQTYEVLSFYLQNGPFKKKIRGPEDIRMLVAEILPNSPKNPIPLRSNASKLPLSGNGDWSIKKKK
ncbi:MAG: hypothetical protein LPJ98_01765 [Cyclobacteriaceae bacterium]|nr:hypothetical protein [Cyclobacteriaceae bacterium]